MDDFDFTFFFETDTDGSGRGRGGVPQPTCLRPRGVRHSAARAQAWLGWEYSHVQPFIHKPIALS